MTTELWTPETRIIRPAPARLELNDAERQSVFVRRLQERHGLDISEFRPSYPPIGGGAAGTWTFTNEGRTKLLDGTFDIDTDSWKMALFLSTSNIGAGSTTFAAVTNEHAAANGYTAGGIAETLTLAGTTTVTVDGNDPVWTASGGSIVARFAVIYEVAGRVLCYCLLDAAPADVTATDGNTLTVQIHASGIFTLA